MIIKKIGKFTICKIEGITQIYKKDKMLQVGNGKKILVDLTKNKIVDTFERVKKC